MASEAGDTTHVFRHVPKWLVEVDLSALGLDESAIATLLDRISISLSRAEGAGLSLDTWRVVHDERSGTPRVRVDAWFVEGET